MAGPLMHKLAVLVVLALLFTSCDHQDFQAPKTTVCNVAFQELLITELMANPVGADNEKEWFEIYNASGHPINLDGLDFIAAGTGRPKTHRVLSELAFTIQPNEYIAVGNAVMGAQTADYSWPEMVLPNAGGYIEIWCADELIDAVSYGNLAEPSQGRSWQRCVLDLEKPDQSPTWCDVDAKTDTYDGENLGTPGQQNNACPMPDHCLDEEGGLRPITQARLWDLIITELYPDTPGADNPMGEWIEIYAFADFDLAGMVLEHLSNDRTRQFKIHDTKCLPLKAGRFYVLSGSDNMYENQGIKEAVPAFSPKGLTLYNSSGTLTFMNKDGEIVAQAEHPAPKSGISIGYDWDSETWCNQRSTGIFDGIGTPGQTNDRCTGGGQ